MKDASHWCGADASHLVGALVLYQVSHILRTYNLSQSLVTVSSSPVYLVHMGYF